MRKKLMFVLSTLAAMLFIQPANAADWRRWLWYDPLQEQVADNLSMIRELNYQYELNRIAVGLTPRWHPGYRDECGHPVSGGGTSRKKAGIISGFVTGGLTYAVIRDPWGALVAGGSSTAMSAAFAGGGRRGPVAGPSAGGSDGPRLSNATQYPVEVYFLEDKGGKEKKYHRGRIAPGDEWPMDGRNLRIPRAGTSDRYVGYPVVFDHRGGTSTMELVPVPVRGGLVFAPPAEAEGR